MAKDLREFLAELKEKLPEKYVEVDKEINSRFEITALLRHLEKKNKYPVLMCNNVLNLKGKGGNRLITNVTADRKCIAVAIGLSPENWRVELTKEFARRTSEDRIKSVVIDRSEAPVKENIQRGDEVDLRDFPFVYHHEMDGNPYGTMVVVAKKPEELGYNLSYHRTMYKDPKRTGLNMAPFHTKRIYNLNSREGKPTPVLIVHGHHPAFFLAGAYTSPWTWEEYEVAGALMGEPLRLTPSETWGEDFLIPADAEVVIEGEVVPNVLEPEGPFGEWPGYIGPQRQNQVINIKAINYRKDYIWYDTDIGHLDHRSLGWESDIYRRVSESLPGAVKGVCLPYSGRAGFHVYISIDNFAEGLVTIASLAAQTQGYPKLIVVVDDDIDPYNEEEVLFAIATRFQADKDLTILKNVRGSMLDPSMDQLTTHSSMIIDATKPFGKPFPERVKVPQDVLDAIKIDNFISKEAFDRIESGYY